MKRQTLNAYFSTLCTSATVVMLMIAGGSVGIGWYFGVSKSNSGVAVPNLEQPDGPVAAVVLAILVWSITVIHVRRRIASLSVTYLSRSFGTCGRCGYDLADRTANGVCPECGERFSVGVPPR